MLTREQLEQIANGYKRGFKDMQENGILNRQSACVMFNSTLKEVSKIISYEDIPLHTENMFVDNFTISLLDTLREVLRVNKDRLMSTTITSLPNNIYNYFNI